MVKAEADRDYYVDLELPPTADANEIKRQFKKLALKYHPDRNPGKELEFNSKFQAIQSANEVLTDPQQRAKYDARRMQSGLLHTYMDNKNPVPPPRPPPRSPTFKYPPPPRPPPPSATKPSFSPPSTGAQKYTRFSRADAPNSWANTTAEDARSKTNDFKAWEQMRHGQVPIPPKRANPLKAQTFEAGRTFPAGRCSNSNAPKTSTLRRSPWEHLQDAGMSRASSARAAPKKTGFVPGDGVLGGDEPPARSAYARNSKERPATARSYTHMAPPPAYAPTARNSNPLQSFATQGGVNDAVGSKRASTPYHMGRGEKTFTNPVLQRSSTSASPSGSNSRPNWQDTDKLKVNRIHVRAASANSVHNKQDQKFPGAESSNSSSSSSSEEAQGIFSRQKQHPKSRRSRMPAGARQRSYFTPNVTMEDAEDETMAPHESLYTGPRRHSGIEIPTYKINIDRPKGFMEHRAKHEAEQSQQQSTSVPTTAAPGPKDDSPRFMHRYKSFDESYASTPKAKGPSFVSANEKDENPMYDIPGLGPFLSPSPLGPLASERWSDQWPFNSPKRARLPTAQTPPYWAIPSSLPPIAESEPLGWSDTSSRVDVASRLMTRHYADCGPFTSFRWPANNEANTFSGPTPLRSQSSDTINLNFSPSGTPAPKFEANNKSYPPPPCDHSEVWSVHSPERTQKAPQHTQKGEEDHLGDAIASETNPRATTVPPSPVHGKYSSVNWNESFSTGLFQWPQNRSSDRTMSRKRAGTPRTSSLNNIKRPGPSNLAGYQPTAVDAKDEPSVDSTTTAEGFNTSTASSSTSSSGNAMDIDSSPFSSAADMNTQTENDPAGRRVAPITPRQGPTLPPRPPNIPQANGEPSALGLGGLKNVAPFAPSNEGLESVDDLKTSLPFESRASPTKPISENAPRRFTLPRLPKAPSPPATLTQGAFDRYIVGIRTYMSQWTAFYTLLLQHFEARNKHRKAMSSNWMSNSGGDFDAYMKAIEEDEKVLKYWEAAHECHKDCMKELGVVRQKARGG